MNKNKELEMGTKKLTDENHSASPINICIIFGYFRPYWLLKILKIFSSFQFGKRVAELFDPNNIRKSCNLNLAQKIRTVEINNGRYILDLNDHMGYQFFVNGSFDECVLWLGSCLNLNRNDVFLDIGANVGYVCVPFSAKFGCEVIAIEASKENCSLLLRNAQLNAVKVQIYNVCVVDKKTTEEDRWIKLYVNNGNRGANSIFESWNPSMAKKSYEYTKSQTVDNLLNQEDIENIKLIKLDIEGAETLALKGMGELLSKDIPIVFEYRIDLMVKDINDDGFEMLNMLKFGRCLFGITKNKGQYQLVEFEASQSYENAIAIPVSKLSLFNGIMNCRSSEQ